MEPKTLFTWTWKIILLGIGIALLVFAGYCFTGAYKTNKTVKRMKQPLVKTAIDLSKPGKYTHALSEVREYFHGLGLIIEGPMPEGDVDKPEALLEGLEGQAVIRKENGEYADVIDFDADDFYCETFNENSQQKVYFQLLEPFSEYEADKSTLSITIEHGAPKLESIELTLLLRYNLCGLESLGIFLGIVFGVISTLIGLGITIPMLRHIVKKLKHRQAATLNGSKP